MVLRAGIKHLRLQGVKRIESQLAIEQVFSFNKGWLDDTERKEAKRHSGI